MYNSFAFWFDTLRKKYVTLNLIWMLARTLFPNDIILSDLRTWACFPVTSVPRVASTAVWANSIGALRVHVTDGMRSGALINV